jgi:uncharacterized membrane protein
MRTRIVIRVAAVTVILAGLSFLMATSFVLHGFGVGRTPVAGSSDAISMTYWQSSSFARMFGVTLLCLGAMLLWCGQKLTEAQQVSATRMLAVCMGFIAILAAAQQTAIWNTSMGWVAVAIPAMMAVGFASCARMPVENRAA